MLKTKLQNPVDFVGQKFYVGIDVHKRSWSVAIRSSGLFLEQFSQPPSARLLVNHLKKKYPGGHFYSAYEAGFSGTGIHEQLSNLGVYNIIVHAADIPLTDKQNKNKTDIHDSRSIAFNLEKGNLHCIYIMPKQQQELRSLFRLRESKVRDVTRTNNRIKSFLLYFGIDFFLVFKGSDYINAKVIEWLSNLKMETLSGTLTLQRHLDDLIYQRKQLLRITQQLRAQIQANYTLQYKCLLSIPGIGPITAMGFIAEIGDFKRFKNPDEYCSFLGLVPWEDSSGESIHTKGVQPRCNKHLRPLIVEASWIAIYQ